MVSLKFLVIIVSFFFTLQCRKEFNAPYLDIKLKDVKGAEHTLREYKGKIVILDFWASWCEPCKKAAPIVSKLKENSDIERTVVMGVNTDNDLSIDLIIEKAKEFGIQYDSLLDPDLIFANELKVQGQPALFVFDRNGKLIYNQYGVKFDEIETLLFRLKGWERL